MTTTELSDNDKALLAREVAADRYGRPAYRRMFIDGWDAAMEWMAKQRADVDQRINEKTHG